MSGPLADPERREQDRSVWVPLTPRGLPPEPAETEPHLRAWSSWHSLQSELVLRSPDG